MNYAEQFNDMVDTYTRAQQNIWKDWLGMMPGLQKRSISASVWQQPIEAWSDFTKRMIETQTQELIDAQMAWIRQGLDESNPWNQLPTFFADWTRQSQEIAENSVEAGKQMMESWLEASGRFSGVEMFQNWNGSWQEAINAWQESANKLLQIQTDTLKSTGKSTIVSEKSSIKARKEGGKPSDEQAA